MRDVDRVVDADPERDRQRHEVEEVHLDVQHGAGGDHQQRAGRGRHEHRDRAAIAADQQEHHRDQAERRDAGDDRTVALDRIEDVREDHARPRGRDRLAIAELQRAHRIREADQRVAVPLVEQVRRPDRDQVADAAILLGEPGQEARRQVRDRHARDVLGRAQFEELRALRLVERIQVVVGEARADLREQREARVLIGGHDREQRVDRADRLLCGW